jgi:hypothetical protein
MWALFIVYICVANYVVWSYWKGRNWARIGVLLYSAVSIFNLLMWKTVSLSPSVLTTAIHIIMAAKAVLAAPILYFLNTRPVLEFFYPESTPPKVGWGRILYGSWLVLINIQALFAPSMRNQLGTHGVPPVTREVLTLITLSFGAWAIAWGIRAGYRPMRETRSTDAAEVSDAPA